MKRSLTLAAIGLLAFQTLAQEQPYQDLLSKFIDEKYEDCLAKALNYTEKDDTKKDPLPFIYVSMCYYEMSKIEKYRSMDEYKKSDKDAVKYAEKFRKKDKNKEFFANYNDYWEDLNKMAMESGLNAYEDEKGLSKAKQWFDGMVGYYPENPGAWIMLALTQYKSNLAKEGDASMAKFQPALDQVGGIALLPEDQKKLLRVALVHYATYMDSKGNRSKAKEMLEVGKDSFMDDNEFKIAYESY